MTSFKARRARLGGLLVLALGAVALLALSWPGRRPRPPRGSSSPRPGQRRRSLFRQRTGMLSIELTGGETVSGLVTGRTKIRCEDQSSGVDRPRRDDRATTRRSDGGGRRRQRRARHEPGDDNGGHGERAGRRQRRRQLRRRPTPARQRPRRQRRRCQLHRLPTWSSAPSSTRPSWSSSTAPPSSTRSSWPTRTAEATWR